MLEQEPSLRARFQKAWQSTVASLDSVGLFAEAGLPAQHGLLAETIRRVFRRFLPMAREEADTGRLFASVFASPRAVQRFLDMDGELFTRAWLRFFGMSRAWMDFQGYAAVSIKRSACSRRA